MSDVAMILVVNELALRGAMLPLSEREVVTVTGWLHAGLEPAAAAGLLMLFREQRGCREPSYTAIPRQVYRQRQRIHEMERLMRAAVVAWRKDGTEP